MFERIETRIIIITINTNQLALFSVPKMFVINSLSPNPNSWDKRSRNTITTITSTTVGINS